MRKSWGRWAKPKTSGTPFEQWEVDDAKNEKKAMEERAAGTAPTTRWQIQHGIWTGTRAGSAPPLPDEGVRPLPLTTDQSGQIRAMTHDEILEGKTVTPDAPLPVFSDPFFGASRSTTTAIETSAQPTLEEIAITTHSRKPQAVQATPDQAEPTPRPYDAEPKQQAYPKPLPPLIIDPTQTAYVEQDELGHERVVSMPMVEMERFGHTGAPTGIAPTIQGADGHILTAPEAMNIAAAVPLDSAQKSDEAQQAYQKDNMEIPEGGIAGPSSGSPCVASEGAPVEMFPPTMATLTPASPTLLPTPFHQPWTLGTKSTRRLAWTTLPTRPGGRPPAQSFCLHHTPLASTPNAYKKAHG